MTTYVPDRRRLIALEREHDLRRNESGGAVAWLEREIVHESRAIAACIIRAAHSSLEVSPEDLNWAGRWVAQDAGWDPRWGREEARHG